LLLSSLLSLSLSLNLSPSLSLSLSLLLLLLLCRGRGSELSRGRRGSELLLRRHRQRVAPATVGRIACFFFPFRFFGREKK
jgi:hypothetical protein